MDLFLTIMDHPAIRKLAYGAVVILAAVLATRMTERLWKRWRDKICASAKCRSPETRSSLDTKMVLLSRLSNAAIYFVAFVIVLLEFEAVRSIGAGLLASAGVAGLIIGMAAQNTISNVIAGISISFSQPVRLNDAIIFEGEFGWIEEIRLMHTILRTWDNRRIMVPNNILVNQVLQNWTIKDPSLLGIVMLHVDYTCDIEQLRVWVKEIVDESPFSTEERVAVVQVVDFSEMSMQLRILARGSDAPSTWNLRCEIREKLMKKLTQAEMPLPRARRETVNLPERT